MLVRVAHQRLQLALLQRLVLSRRHALPGAHLLGQEQHLRRLGGVEVEGVGHGGLECRCGACTAWGCPIVAPRGGRRPSTLGAMTLLILGI